MGVQLQEGALTDPTLQALVSSAATLNGTADPLSFNTQNSFFNVNTGSADAMTLGAPNSGSQFSAVAPGQPTPNGDDGKVVIIRDNSGHAHTITTGANGINGNKHIATFGGTAGSYIELTALGGVWYMTAESGVTLS